MRIPTLTFSLFRLIFGGLMIPQVLSLVPHIHDLSKSVFVFHYPYLSFVNAYSHSLIDILGGAAIIGSILLSIGIIPRIGSALFGVCFTYLFLIDQSFYNNHYYLWCLIAFTFSIIRTDQSISIIDLVKKNFKKEFHISNQIILCILISIVYFFGGTAKLNVDWLNGYPMRLMMISRNLPHPQLLGYFVSYTGLLFDLLIPFLLWKKAKSWGVAAIYFTFHFSNYFIFNIGEFPLVMIVAYLLFIPLNKLKFKELVDEIKSVFTTGKKAFLYGLFFLVQILVPIRALLFFPANVAWHRQGYNFSWRMMLNNYESMYFQYRVEIPEIQKSYMVNFEKMLTYRQYYHLYHEPYMIWQLAGKLKADAIKKYNTNMVYVYCKSIVKLNQHPAQDLINETIDLTSVSYNFFKPNKFILEFK